MGGMPELALQTTQQRGHLGALLVCSAERKSDGEKGAKNHCAFFFCPFPFKQSCLAALTLQWRKGKREPLCRGDK